MRGYSTDHRINYEIDALKINDKMKDEDMKRIMIAIAALSVLTGCLHNGMGQPGAGINKETVGKVVGAGLGAWAGSNVGGGKGRVAALSLIHI